ncbi:pyridoxamine 5'-phosphate oxidase family protein [Pectinatus haikarae]|uniref:Pyridoxamine 5'-phosphate oxidase family protein n=1 Tax=Pectinatus haikarae TaxID=349096 RepID=A0ABT9Y682_9FIRM|nr:pyridoxamine 5'-phosphate oxidase family protein [Pectinatus haikarae]MDQ0203345.1 putative pyridoxamine 5'-phosphate oxidase family protein [Pectinatus haikarae]
MKDILKFLKTNKIFYLATTCDNIPHIRPLGFVMEYNGKLTFCTSNQNDMYKQLVLNPNLEICCVDIDYNLLRINGTAVFCTTEDSQKEALQTMPSLGNLYSVGDGIFEIFHIENVHAVLQTISGEKTILQ